MSKNKATKLPDLNKEPQTPTLTIQEQARAIDDPISFYLVLENLFKRCRENPKLKDPKNPDAVTLVYIGDCYKELSIAADKFIYHTVGNVAIFREEAVALAIGFRGMLSFINKAGGTFLKVQKNDMVLQMFIAP